MDIITIIVTAGVASLVTLIANLIIQGIQFRKEYYHKIIERRIEAYIKLDNLVTYMSSSTIFNHKVFLVCLFDKTSYQHLYDLFKSAKEHEIWFGLKTTEEFMKLNTLLVNKIGLNIYLLTDEMVQENGYRFSIEIQNQRFELRKSIYKDLKQIYKIRKFLKEKGNEKYSRIEIDLNKVT